MENTRVNLTVQDSYLDRFDEVVRGCTSVGMQIEQTLEFAGVISGVIATDKLIALEQVQGVAVVEVERTIQLPPPDDDVQ